VREANFRIGASEQETLRRIKIFGCISENVSTTQPFSELFLKKNAKMQK